MNNIKKRLIALSIAGFMTTGISGCDNNSYDPINYTANVETGEDLISRFTLDSLKEYYVIEVIDFEGEHRFYLTYKIDRNLSKAVGYEEYKISGSEIVVATRKENSNKYTGDYGEIVNVVKFIQYVQKYSTLKENYKIEEIEGIMNKINDDYKNSKEVKTKSFILK